ncbi:MAG: DUF2062 domain-containing protein [Desulfobulbaceae bacterium]|uniref:DUF2062 domain-containing protein n=1 Tax=Candidatus Desulfobia pelagia TaxID=2841692 RepID=A0A8J6ND37_9BACT|nr:DUF2062 domain-containing protein [Candidatus Desulfobia pelagia]
MNKRFFKYYYLRFIRLQGDPREIARGIAIGVFIGITPTIPLHTVLILATALLLRAGKIAGLLASFVVSNPLTFFFQYFFSWRIGTWLLPYDLSWERIQSVMAVISGGSSFKESIESLGKLGWESIMVMLSGGILLALPFTLASYFLSLWFFNSYRRRKKKKIE